MNSQLKPQEPFVLGNVLLGYLPNKDFWIQYSDTENDVLLISSERKEYCYNYINKKRVVVAIYRVQQPSMGYSTQLDDPSKFRPTLNEIVLLSGLSFNKRYIR